MSDHPIFLQVENLSHTYYSKNGATKALSHVNLTLENGEFGAIIGPSGCGKSTLLDLIGGYIPLQTGQISYPALQTAPSIGYMLQKDHLLEYRNIWQNVTLGLEITKQKTPERLEEVRELMKQYDILTFSGYYPRQLSGGMRQRAALIRTLATKPDFLLLDEPFSALDYQTRLEVSEDICSIIRQKDIPALLVTHDLSEAISIADKIFILGKRPGSIRSVLPIHFEADHPVTPQEARTHPQFPDYFNLIWKELKADDEQT